MPLPVGTKVWKETMDPYDKVDYKVDLTKIVLTTEEVVSFTVTPLTESQLYGLTVGTGAYASTIVAKQLTVWLSIASQFQNDPVFKKGLTLPLELTIVTDSTPPRTKQRTVAVKVIQR